MTTNAIVSCALLLVIGGCTTKQAYNNIQSERLRQCNKIVRESERSECLQDSGLPYKDYKRERAKLVDTTLGD